MDAEKLTRKCQEAMQEAEALALNKGHGEVDGEHLLAAMLEQSDGLLSTMLTRLEVDQDSFAGGVARTLEKLPRVSRPGGEIYIARRLQQLLVVAGGEAAALTDDYVSV